jgi:hypothetical protein
MAVVNSLSELEILASGSSGTAAARVKEMFDTLVAASNDPAYTAAGSSNWATSPPVTVADAIDRMAAAFATHLGIPIP